ncbi:MAG: membrane dipeptidase [Bacteroidota bacterium]
MFIFDAHLDLSMNAMEWNRDLRLPISEIREREKGQTDKPDRGLSTVNFAELKKGNIGIVVATQIARFVEKGSLIPGWQSPEQAWAQTQGQLAWYQAMEAAGEMKQITNLKELEAHLAFWNDGQSSDNKPIGYILSLEGADSLIDVSYVEKAFNYGLRAIGPAHYGPGRYAKGTNATGFMGIKGQELLKEMERFNIILDATHLCDDSFWEALDHFNGNIWASHNLCRSLVNHNRQFSDEQIKELINRGAVIGGALDAWMMVPNWQRGVSTPEAMNCNLEVLVDHFDHICQLAGNCNHIAIGTDLDGGFGKEQGPYDIDTIADLQKIPTILTRRGYSTSAIEKVMHGNWLKFLRKAWG